MGNEGLFTMGSQDKLFAGLGDKSQQVMDLIGRELVNKGYKEKKDVNSNARVYTTTWTSGAIIPYVENEDLRLRYTFHPTLLTGVCAFIGAWFYLVGFVVVAVLWFFGMYHMRKEMMFEGEHQANSLMNKSKSKDLSAPPPPVDKIEQIAKLKELCDKGVLTQEEFTEKKQKLLAQI